MDSDLKLIGILSLLVVILGIVFTLRITIFKDDRLSSPNTNLATTNTVVSESKSETDIDSISTMNIYSNTTTNNDINNTREELEREAVNKRLNELNEGEKTS